jgi:hypothetical protein
MEKVTVRVRDKNSFLLKLKIARFLQILDTDFAHSEIKVLLHLLHQLIEPYRVLSREQGRSHRERPPPTTPPPNNPIFILGRSPPRLRIASVVI